MIRNTRSKSLEYSSGFIVQPSIPEHVWVSPFVSALFNVQGGAPGLNLSSDQVPRSSSAFPSEKSADPQSSGRVSWIVLVEDNPGDVALVREAFYEYGIRSELTVIFDG